MTGLDLPALQDLHIPASRSGGSLTAVLIDDMPEVRQLLRVALEDVGIVVVGEAGDGASGVEVTALRMPDIVVLDVAMPIMDGIAALPWIRDTVPEAKIVMLSAYNRSLAGGPEASSAADAYVEKGHVDVFVRTVLSLCGQDPEQNPPIEGSPSATGPDAKQGMSLLHPELLTAPLGGVPEAASGLDVHAFPLSATAELDVSRQALQALVHVAGHDLVEPVHLVVGFTERLARRWDALGLDPGDREYVTFTSAAATQLQVMVDALADYLQACTEPLEIEELSGVEVTEEVLGTLGHVIRDRNAKISTHGMPDRLYASRYALATTLRHLVHNALSFTTPGISPLIDISAVSGPDRWTFTVRDNGPGLDERDVERVFRPFKRMGEPTPQSGVGMGLAICRQLVARHGGGIIIRSAGARGAEVVFTLPVVEPPAIGIQP